MIDAESVREVLARARELEDMAHGNYAASLVGAVVQGEVLGEGSTAPVDWPTIAMLERDGTREQILGALMRLRAEYDFREAFGGVEWPA